MKHRLPLRFLSLIAICALFSIFNGCDEVSDQDTPPTGAIQNPKTGSIIARTVKVAIIGQAFHESEDNRVEKVNISVDGDAVGEATRTSYGLKPAFVY